jgi:hypothetical protein
MPVECFTNDNDYFLFIDFLIYEYLRGSLAVRYKQFI